MKALMLTALAVLLAWPATAQQCAPYGDMANIIAREGQARRGMGLDAGEQLPTLWTAPDGAWTLTITKPDGTTCVVGTGTAYSPLSDPAGEVM